VEASQALNIQPSDTNGDGTAAATTDTAAMTQFIQQRTIQENDPLGIRKPHGCFTDVSIRLVKGKQAKITTIWVNHRVEGTSKHDNSSPICQTECSGDEPSAIAGKDDLTSVSDARQEIENGHKASENSIPVTAVAALSFAAFLSLVLFFSRRSGPRSARSYLTLPPRDEEDLAVE